MNPSVLKIFFHLGAIVQTVKDLEVVIGDVAEGKSWGEDGKRALADLASLIESGVICIPNLDSKQASQAIADLLAHV